MATALTHAYIGVLLAPLAPAGLPRRLLYVALVLLAVLPDADLIGDVFGVPYAHELGHRGFTHSLLFAAFAGGAGAWFVRRHGVEAVRDRIRLAAVFALATASHGILDALTDGGKGVGFFIPLSNERFFFPWRPLRVVPLELDRLQVTRIGDILRSELLWVWVPATAIAVAARLTRRARRSS